MTNPTIGRSLHYRLSEKDAVSINGRRRDRSLYEANPYNDERVSKKPTGFQDHVGNTVQAGDVVALTVTRVAEDGSWVNGQAILDGNDTHWVCSATEGTKPGEWAWPQRS